jgi:hypothetical protein
MSENDKALGVSQFVTRRQRLGQNYGELDPAIREALTRHRDRISYINVSPADGASAGNGSPQIPWLLLINEWPYWLMNIPRQRIVSNSFGCRQDLFFLNRSMTTN